MELVEMGVFTWSLLLGAIAGVVDAFGQAGRIPAYGGGNPIASAGMAIILAGLLAMMAETGRGALILALSGLGAAAIARLVTSAILNPHA